MNECREDICMAPQEEFCVINIYPNDQESIKWKICIVTYSHEFSAGSHKLSEAQEEVLFCGQDLSQLLEGVHKWIRHTYSKNN